MGSACLRLSNSIDNIFEMIAESIQNESARKIAYTEVIDRCMTFHVMIINNMMSHVESSSPEYSLNFYKKHGSSLGVFDVKLGDAMAKVGLNEEALTMYKGSEPFWRYYDSETTTSIVNRIKTLDPSFVYKPSSSSSGGCYIATAVYGSYDCPQVWTLRRYRDYTLAETLYGRAFIHTYYAISPTLVKLFGHTDWFKKMWKGKLDRMVADLNAEGVKDTPYEDRNWE